MMIGGLSIRTPELVGRDKELGRMRAALAKAMGGEGQSIFISGGAGLGMTRVVNELLFQASKDGVMCLRSKCLFREGANPFLPFTDALKDLTDRSKDGGTAEDVGEDDISEGPRILPMGLIGIGGNGVEPAKARKRVALSGFGKEHEKAMGGSRGTDFTKEREQVFSKIATVLTEISSEQPVALFLDDLHWADSATFQLLSYIIRNSQDQRLLIIGAFRTAELETRKGHPLKEVISRARREGRCTIIKLKPLKKEDIEKMIMSMLEVKKVPKDFISLMLEETEGNPFFIEEVIRSFVEEGIIAETGADLGRVDIKKVKVPSNVADLIKRKIDGLNEEQRKVLEYAAVIGEAFPIDILVRVMQVEEMDLVDILERLIQLQIIEELTEGSEIGYRFTYKQFREVVYDNLSSARRRLAHKKVGLALEGLPKKARDKMLFALAHHLSMSAEFDKAIEYTTMAAEMAESSFAAEDAITYYENVLELLDQVPTGPDIPLRKKVIINKIAHLKFMTESWSEAMHYLRALEKVAKAQGDEIILAEVYLKVGHIQTMRGAWNDAVESYGRSLEISEKINDEAGIAETLQGLGHIYAVRANYDVAKAYLEKSMDISREAKDTLSLGRTQIELGHVFRDMGNYDDALGTYTDGLMLLEESGDPFSMTRGLMAIGDLCMRTKEWDKAIEFYDDAQKKAEKTKDIQMRAWALFKLGESYAHKGDFNTADKFCGQALMNIIRTDDRVGLAYAYSSYGAVFRLKGDFGKAFVQFQQALNTANDLDMPAVIANINVEIGLMYRDKDDKDTAKRFFEKAKKLYEKVENKSLAEQADRLLEGLDRYGQPTKGSAQDYLSKSMKAMQRRTGNRKGKGSSKRGTKKGRDLKVNRSKYRNG